MDDIVDRLVARANKLKRDYDTCCEDDVNDAIAEITRLREERQTWRSRMGLKVESDIVRENIKLREFLSEFAGSAVQYDAGKYLVVQVSPVLIEETNKLLVNS